MTFNRFLAIVATVLFAVALVILVADDTVKVRTLEILTLGGLTAFAGAHAV